MAIAILLTSPPGVSTARRNPSAARTPSVITFNYEGKKSRREREVIRSERGRPAVRAIVAKLYLRNK